MAVTIKWADGREELCSGRAIARKASLLLIYEGVPDRKSTPIRVVRLDEFIWARDDDGELVLGRGKEPSRD